MVTSPSPYRREGWGGGPTYAIQILWTQRSAAPSPFSWPMAQLRFGR